MPEQQISWSKFLCTLTKLHLQLCYTTITKHFYHIKSTFSARLLSCPHIRGPEWPPTRNGTWCAHYSEQHTAFLLSDCDLRSWVIAKEICCLCSYHPTWSWLDSHDLVCLYSNITWPQPAVLLVPHGNTAELLHGKKQFLLRHSLSKFELPTSI